MCDLRHAGTDLKKAAYTEGIRVGRKNAWFKPVTDNERGIKAIVGDATGKEIEVTVQDLEYIHQFSWAEIKEGRV